MLEGNEGSKEGEAGLGLGLGLGLGVRVRVRVRVREGGRKAVRKACDGGRGREKEARREERKK